MKKNSLILCLILFVFIPKAKSQDKEWGFFAGTCFYIGEINQTKLFYPISPAAGIIFRNNLTKRFTLRLDGTVGQLKANDADFASVSKYQQERGKKFSTNFADVALQMEFDFFNYDKLSQFDYYTPYLIAGVAILISNNAEAPVAFSIPFGFGFKFAATKRLSIGGEWTFRKCFTDYLDLIPVDKHNYGFAQYNKQRSNSTNQDWYSFFGLILTYNVSKTVDQCPAYKY